MGGLLGGIIYTLALPTIQPIHGPDLGVLSLNATLGSSTIYYILSTLIAIVFIGASSWLQRIDKVKDKKWILTGIALAILNAIVFSSAVANRPIGASTTFPYVGDLISGLTNNDYYTKIEVLGNWEVIFLTGAFIAALVTSLIKKDFKLVHIYENWQKRKGDSKPKRIIWSLVGGFILIFGARMAGGCTSGHILSGGMQLAYSSLFFAAFTFVGLLVTGKIFYKST